MTIESVTARKCAVYGTQLHVKQVRVRIEVFVPEDDTWKSDQEFHADLGFRGRTRLSHFIDRGLSGSRKVPPPPPPPVNEMTS